MSDCEEFRAEIKFPRERHAVSRTRGVFVSQNCRRRRRRIMGWTQVKDRVCIRKFSHCSRTSAGSLAVQMIFLETCFEEQQQLLGAAHFGADSAVSELQPAGALCLGLQAKLSALPGSLLSKTTNTNLPYLRRSLMVPAIDRPSPRMGTARPGNLQLQNSIWHRRRSTSRRLRL